MREPGVVRRPGVQKMSWGGIGLPVRGVAFPLERSWSALLAAGRAPASSTLMKALSSSWRAMRSRQARVSSTEEIFLAASAAESSRSVALSKLLDDLGDQIQAVFDRGRDGLIKLARVAAADFVRPQPLSHVDGVGHRLDSGGIDRAHLVDQAEHAVQAIEHRAGFLGLDRDARKAREAPHVVGG